MSTGHWSRGSETPRAKAPGEPRDRKVLDAISRLRRGDVIDVHSGKKKGRYAVIEVSQSPSERRPKVLALSESRSMQRFAASDFHEPPSAIATLRLPKGFQMRDAGARRDVAARLKTVVPKRFKESDPPDQPARGSEKLDESSYRTMPVTAAPS